MWLEPTEFTNTSSDPDDPLPMKFHSVHTKNIRISSDGSTARCVDSKAGVAFSARPIEVNEKVGLRLMEGSNSPFVTLRVGFIFCDPMSLLHTVENYTIYDCNPLIISRTLENYSFKFNKIVHYYMSSSGNLHYGIDGEDKGLFMYGNKAHTKLWAYVHISAKTNIVQFVDPRDLNEAIRRYAESQERQICSLGSLSIEEPLRPPRYKNPLVPLSLHRMTGSNIQFVDERGVAARIEADFCQGYVFTAHPVRPGQTIVVQILATETKYVGRSAVGLTSCDPASLSPCDLPFYTDRLLDRSEYWVVHEVVADELQAGDEIVATLTSDGEMRVTINESNLETVMHVDHTVRLWAFVNMFGKIQKVRIFSSPEIQAPTPPQQLRVLTSSAAPIATGGTGTVHDVNLQPHNGSQNVTNNQQELTLTSGHDIEPVQSTSQQILAGLQQSSTHPPTCSLVPQPHCPRTEGQRSTASQNDSSEQIPNENSEPLRHERIPNGPSTSQEQENNLTEKECIICYENPIDSVLYMCGHMCMCYRCAVQLWKGMDDGQCPLCRTEIRDVIRTYK